MPVTGYDAKAIEKHYDMRPLQVGWRLNSLGLPLLAWYGRLLMDRANGVLNLPSVQRQRGKELREVFVRSKSVALIKSGQAFSLRPDIIKNKIWAEELGKLVDAVGSFSDVEAMSIIQKIVANDPVLSLFEFENDYRAVASASIGQVYKAKLRRGPQLEAAIGKEMAAKWGGRYVAIKVQRPDVASSVSLDMYLLRRTATWLSKMRSGDILGIADQFGMQLFGELDYEREADNCLRFRDLYGKGWDDKIMVPDVCTPLTRKKVLVMEWVDGVKGPWDGEEGIEIVRLGLKCSVDQLMTTGLFHADPHRGNLLKTPDGKLAFIDFGMMADIDEEDRYGLFGLCIGLQNKNLPLVTENLLQLGFLDDTSNVDELIPRLRSAVKNATGGSGKMSDVNFAKLQAELDAISRENLLQFSTPPFFTVIIRSLTILEGVALSVDPRFRLVRGSYPYVLRSLLVPDADDRTPVALQKLLIRLLTVNGEGKEIDWEQLRDLLRLAQ
ncbi:ABC1-domain-containing protein, partial [Fragilariopsis cylindrus CCMP1102]